VAADPAGEDSIPDTPAESNRGVSTFLDPVAGRRADGQPMSGQSVARQGTSKVQSRPRPFTRAAPAAKTPVRRC